MRERLWEVLQVMQNDQRQAWDMRSDGSYVQRKPGDPSQLGTHQTLMNLTKQRAAGVRHPEPATPAAR